MPYFCCGPKIILAAILITFLSPKIALPLGRQVSSQLRRIMMSSLVLGMVLPVSLVDDIIWLPCVHDVVLLTLVHTHYSSSSDFTADSLCVLERS